MIYLDNASTTKINDVALEKFCEFSTNFYYNPSSPHKAGFKNSLLLCQQRDNIKKLLGIKPQDALIFCSGATEANNSVLRSFAKNGSKIAVSIGEHPSILNVCKDLESKGEEVFYIKLKFDGTIDIDDLINIMSNNKIDLVSVMNVSNETGAINDIQKIVKICKTINPQCIVHSDGVQAVGKIKVNLATLGVDLYSFSGHKFGGPKGIGGLFIKKGVNYKPLLLGGGQESGLRSGTENLPAIASMECALSQAVINLEQNFAMISGFKQYIMEYFKNDSGIIFNTTDNNSPYILSMSIPKLKGEVLVHFLEQEDILIGKGSACSSKKAGNNTLQAMGLKKDNIIGSLRLSFSPNNTIKEIEYFCDKMKEIIDNQRALIK